MDNDVKIRITTDASGAITGFKTVRDETEKTERHTQSALASFKSHWLAASVAVGTAMVAMNKAWDMAKKGAEFKEQEGILDNLARKYSTTADSIVRDMQRASEGLVAKADLMQVALGGIAKGLKPDQLTNLADAAKILGDAVGKDATTALQDLTQALETGRTRGLKNYLGSAIDLEASFGELTKRMTEAEKAQALYNIVVIEATKLQDQQAKSTDNAADKIERIEARWKDLMTSISIGVKTVIIGAIDALDKLAEAQADADYDMSGMGGQPLHVPKRANASMKIIGGASGDLSKDDLSLLDNTLLKRNLAGRDTKSTAASGAKEKLKEIQEATTGVILNIEDAYRASEKAIEDITKAAEEGFSETLNGIKKFEDELNAAFGNIMGEEQFKALNPYEQAIERIKSAERAKYEEIDRLRSLDQENEEKYAKAKELIAKNAAEEIQKTNAETFQANIAALSSGFGQLESAFSSMAGLYAKGSKDAEQWEEAAKAMEIAQRSLAVVNAVVAVASASSAPWPAGLVTGAAMLASMIALLASIGESIGGGGATAMATPALSKSTVLGAEAGTGSESIANSLAILADTYDMENVKLTQIYNEMCSLNDNITGLVTSIVRTGGISIKGIGGLGSGIGPGREAWNNGLADVFSGGPVFGQLPLMQWINDFFGGLGESIFGGGTETVISGQGISFGKNLVSSILEGGSIKAREYAIATTTTSGGWFGSDSTESTTYYEKLNSDVSRMLTLVFKNMSNSLVYMATELGTNVAEVYGYVFNGKELNLQDMSGEKMNKALNEYFSNAGDKAVKKLFGDLVLQYQQLNEGLMETAVRLISDKNTIAAILELTNQTFSGTTSEFIKFSESLIKVAGGLDKLTDAYSTYYEAFFSDAEKQADYKKQMQGVLGSYGYSLPMDRIGYRNIVENQDLKTSAGQSAYYALMAISGTADKYYDYIERGKETARSNINPADYATSIEYQRALARLPRYADGGYTPGGWAMVGEQGPEPVYFDTPARVVSSKDSKSLIDINALISELRATREEIRRGNVVNATYNQKTANKFDKWDRNGMPPERTN